jgi:predicted nucleic acid-binding Zn ribbon protein
MGKGPRHLRSLLGEAYASLGVAPDSPETVLRSRWPEAVGADVAAVTEVDRLEQGRLVITAGNPVWCFELSMRREALRDSLNAFLGADEIREVQVKGRRFNAA